MNARKKGFTLIEMLLVVGIIAILSSAVVFSFRRVMKSAGRAKAVELVSNARTALEEMYRRNDGWPQGIYNANKQEGYYVMDEAIAKLFARNDLLTVDCYKDRDYPDDMSKYKLRGKDRCGIVDPWAQDVLMRKPDNGLATSVPSGGTVQDHRLYFAVDKDDDGFVSKEEGAPGNSVRAKAIVWCAGADGGLSDCSTAAKKSESSGGRTVSNGDNVYSWDRAQEDKK